VLPAVLGGTLLTLAALAAAGGPLLSAHPARWRPHLLSVPRSTPSPDSVSHAATGLGYAKTPPPPSTPVPHWVTLAAAVVVIAGFTLFLALLAAALLRSSVWRALVPAIDAEASPTVSNEADEQREQFAARVDAALADLDSSPDPRAAVIASWRRLEFAVADVGVDRAPSETPGELSQRVVASLAIDPQPLVRLNRLYRAARYSPTPVAEADRDSARDALRSVRSELDRLAPTRVPS